MRPFICDLCLKAFAFDWQLNHHKKSCGKTWSCLGCDKTYAERLSLITHCKRHGHRLPEEARFRKKNNDQVKLVVLPVIIGQVHQNGCIPLDGKPMLLPKATSKGHHQLEAGTQTANQTTTVIPGDSHCIPNGSAARSNFVSTNGSSSTHSAPYRKMQSGTQTERPANRKASTAAQCTPARRRPRKRKSDQATESAETQTLESVLAEGPAFRAAASTNTRDISTFVSPLQEATIQMEGYDCHLVTDSNPLLCQLTNAFVEYPSAATIAEQSVQTDMLQRNAYTTMETQTIATELPGYPEQEFFLDFDVNDIDTQTYWNHESGTQTEESATDFFANLLY